MGLNINISQGARHELVLILDACEANFGTKSAHKLYKNIMDTIRMLSNMPQAGSVCEDLKELGNFRSFYVPNQTRIIYYANETSLNIVLFWNTRRNPQTLIRLISTRHN